MSEKQVTTVVMPRELHEKVRKLAFERRVSMGELLRRFILAGIKSNRVS
jgi:hypothetical protein